MSSSARRSQLLPPVKPSSYRTRAKSGGYGTTVQQMQQSPHHSTYNYPHRESQKRVNYNHFDYENSDQWDKRHTYAPWSRTLPSYHPRVIRADDPLSVLTSKKRTQLSQQYRALPFKIGSRCVIDDGRSGTVLWIGLLDIPSNSEIEGNATKKEFHRIEPHVGLRLDDAAGEHDGIVNGRRYFSCRMHHGTVCKATRMKFYMNRNQTDYQQIEKGEDASIFDPLGNLAGSFKELMIPDQGKSNRKQFASLYKSLEIAKQLGEREQQALDAEFSNPASTHIPNHTEIMKHASVVHDLQDH